MQTFISRQLGHDSWVQIHDTKALHLKQAERQAEYDPTHEQLLTMANPYPEGTAHHEKEKAHLIEHGDVIPLEMSPPKAEPPIDTKKYQTEKLSREQKMKDDLKAEQSKTAERIQNTENELKLNWSSQIEKNKKMEKEREEKAKQEREARLAHLFQEHDEKDEEDGLDLDVAVDNYLESIEKHLDVERKLMGAWNEKDKINNYKQKMLEKRAKEEERKKSK